MFFKRKTKEEKILEEMKVKKAQIDKLKEEMNNMAKLVLKDGKLQKVEDVKKEEPQKEVLPPSPPPGLDTRQNPRPNFTPQMPLPPTPPMSMQNRYNEAREAMERAAYQQQMREQEAYEQQQAYQAQQQQLHEQQLYQQEMQRQQQLAMQQQAYQQPMPSPQYARSYTAPIPQPKPNVKVDIELVNGSIISINVPEDMIPTFIKDLDEAIDGQSVFPINNKIINGRNIISYTIG